MISTCQAQEIMRSTRNPHVLTLCETVIDLWRMFGEANCDAVSARDEIEALTARSSKIETSPMLQQAAE